MDNPFIVGFGGAGDLLLSLQCAHFSKLQGENPQVCMVARRATFEPVSHLFSGDYSVFRHSDGEKWHSNEVCNNPDAFLAPFNRSLKTDRIYVVEPDLLFRNPHAFDYERYHTCPQTIRSVRLLLHKRKKAKRMVYVGLNSSTEGYVYHDVPELVARLALDMPNHTIHCPILSAWAGKDLNMGQFNKWFPHNVEIVFNPKFSDSLDVLAESEFCVCADNGISHFAYNLGIPRLLLDPKHIYQDGRACMPWIARWRQDLSESVPIESSVADISRLVYTCVNEPQTTLIPRMAVIQNLDACWNRELLFKY